MERVLKARHEQLPLPKHVSVPEPTQHEHATAMLTGQEIDKALEPSEECVRAPLSTGFRQRIAGRSTSPLKDSCQTPPASGKSARIGIKAKTKILFIDAADLIAVEAKGNHVLLVHTSSSHILRGAISNIEEKLNLHGFVRIHRSVLVNAGFVEEIHARPSGEYVLRVRGGREFTVTRTYRKNLRLLAQLWIGMEGFDAK